jgi:DNA modification methylase
MKKLAHSKKNLKRTFKKLKWLLILSCSSKFFLISLRRLELIKNLKLLDRIIKMYSNENDLVVDIFAGSGTTGISAIGNNRNYYLFDINPKAKEIFDERINANN